MRREKVSVLCHVLLLLPILALPVFWLWPLSVSVPVYSVTAGLSIALYVGALRAMRKPVLTGREHMVGAKGAVVATEGGHVTVNIDAELWTATSVTGPLGVGDEVRVVGIDGLKLRVKPLTQE